MMSKFIQFSFYTRNVGCKSAQYKRKRRYTFKVCQKYYLLFHILFSMFLSNFLTHPKSSFSTSFHDMLTCSHLAARFPMGLSLHVLVKFPMGYVRDDYGEGKTL